MGNTQKKRNIITLTSVFLIALVLTGAFLYLGIKIDSLHAEVNRMRSSLFEELESQQKKLKKLDTSQRLVVEDMRETREILDLSTGSYGLEDLSASGEDEEGPEEDSSTSSRSTGMASDPSNSSSSTGMASDPSIFYKAVERIKKSEERRKVKKSVAELFSDDTALGKIVDTHGLDFRKEGELLWKLIPQDTTPASTDAAKIDGTSSSADAAGAEGTKEGAPSPTTTMPTTKLSLPDRENYTIRASKTSSSAYTLTIASPTGEKLDLTFSPPAYEFETETQEEGVGFIKESEKKIQELRSRRKENLEQLRRFINSSRMRELLEEMSLEIEHVRSKGEAGVRISYPVSGDWASFGLKSAFGMKSLTGLKTEGGFYIRSAEEKSSKAENSSFGDFTSFSQSVLKAVKKIDTKSTDEKRRAEAVEQIRRIAEDEAFSAFLQQRDLRLSTSPREGIDHLYFDLLRGGPRSGSDGTDRIGAFAVNKKNGWVSLVDAEDVVISSLERLKNENEISSLGKGAEHESSSDADFAWKGKELEAEDKPEGKTFLVCGVHQKNADSIMLVHLSEARIAILSIPRDIYYEQRKLSKYYQAYGPKQFTEVVSDLTGISIDGYVSVDMYAFIEIVDILGGINITLEEALIDPTYTVREDGVWKTLYYPKGNYTLEGIEALRIARSRHSTDDFDRAKRQYLIFEGLKRKIDTLHAGKIDTLKKIFSTLAKYVHTDIPLIRSVRLFSAYHDTPVHSFEGLSTENVLYSTYSNIHRSGKTKDEVGEDFPKGAWILLPKQEDWSLIQKYVRYKLYASSKERNEL